MTFHRQRHQVLAGNVANVDTPGFKPMDLERSGERTNAFEDAGALQSANGNAVNLERELAKIDANRVRYDTSSSLVSRRIALLKYAAADGVG